MTRMPNGKPVRIVALCAAVASIAALLLFTLNALWLSHLDRDFSRLAMSGNRLPVSLTVYGRTTDDVGIDTISARINFYNADGDFVGTVERSWTGWELKIDCVMIGTGQGWLAFPYRAYTDETKIGHGVDLLRSYGRGGFPSIYESSQLTGKERSALRRLFSFVLTERWLPAFLGGLRHETVSIRSFEAGSVYSLYITRTGKLKLLSN